ncbi:enhancer of yellow 2b transcription factor [Scaptodrosophila lebanonensis]|uniref:Enhancer of yellow 2 transcription factor n=1 Tax=Drosophila lebanonensis TaxID=7225 RepID=A0A6J2TBN5_DROLE|nr:enhancer of yellow 2b transcription factor [Scaptodrosophila lebanonensis]
MADSKEMGTDAEPIEEVKLNKRDSLVLKDLLEKRLSECGWRQNIEELIRKTVQERGNISHEQLAAEIVPHARAMVPDVVRKEMILRVRAALEEPLPVKKD